MIHKDIRRLTIEGELADSDMERHKEEIIKTLYDILRDDGHMPLLDMDPQFTVSYDFDKDVRVFKLSVFGVQGEKPWDYSGVFGGRAIKKYTANRK